MGSAAAGRPAGLEGHGRGFRPQHQECEDGTHCLREALATYIPREGCFFFFNSKQPGNWKYRPASFRKGVPLSTVPAIKNSWFTTRVS